MSFMDASVFIESVQVFLEGRNLTKSFGAARAAAQVFEQVALLCPRQLSRGRTKESLLRDVAGE
jgi:hypothetical protein